MKIIFLFVLVLVTVVLYNNLDSNVYAQEIQCPLVHPFLPLVDVKYSPWLICHYEFKEDIDGDGVLEHVGDSYISVFYAKSDDASLQNTACWEWNTSMASQMENSIPRLVALKSNSHYIVTTYQNTDIDTPLSNSVSDATIRLLHEIEGSRLALPCEPSDFQFDIDVPVFANVKQGDPVNIPVQVILVKGEPVPISLSTTTWQGNLGIYGQFVQNTVTPTQSTSLLVQTSCSTPPDNYQFYVNGIATSGKVPASSTDMVTVTVESKSDCSSQNNQQIGQQSIISGSVSASLDSAYQLVNQGKYQEALPYLDSVLQQEPDNVVALGDKANALINLEKYEEALTYYDKALQQKPDDKFFLSGKGEALKYLEKYEEALTYYDKALQQGEDSGVSLEGRGFSLFMLKRYDESIQVYDKLLEQHPDEIHYLLGKGSALSNSGKYQEALPYFDKVLEIEPENTYAQQNKKITLEKINTPETPKSSDKGGGCLIATATYDSELAPQVQQLRELRDNSLLQTASGTSFMSSFNSFYYSFSPTIADWERENPVFKEAVKLTLTPMISSLSILNYVDMDSEVKVLGYGISLIMLNVGMYFVAPAVVIHTIRKKF